MADNLSSWISPSYLSSTTQKKLAKDFSHAKPFPYLVLPDFLLEEKLTPIRSALLKESFVKKESDLFKLSQTQDIIGTKQQPLKLFRSFLLSKPFLSYMTSLTSFSFSSKAIDLHGSLYQDTDFLLWHDDQLEGRKIAFLLYLSDLKNGDGGTLNLLNSKSGKPTNIATRIIPQSNTFAFFEVSSLSFHEVEEVVVKTDRLALGGWLHG
ncbi:2OG-Fe(II) oxygenase [Candidatus Woesearchaeota archaeon]|nr:2OG-Fe(II) oxygenase [Candidatus Woesearchaeota archaeon]